MSTAPTVHNNGPATGTDSTIEETDGHVILRDFFGSKEVLVRILLARFFT
jgi:hypothetical protein